ncbi:hypothetical protein H4R18_003028 [Coemansia javaensis]|uniref:Uncharacterized protein n=1 Tax=Coemansia javaensis TaxID=2761396 RepID=A0A9W8HFZ2_9FUNG|nr:hypothetical protein H4R18_003028 [Coemansia javaensis]
MVEAGTITAEAGTTMAAEAAGVAMAAVAAAAATVAVGVAVAVTVVAAAGADTLDLLTISEPPCALSRF